MTKDKIKNEKGITLVTLAIAVTILIIMVDVVVYNLKDRLELETLKEMQNDIENLSDKISAYYAQNGKIPASIEYGDAKGNIQKIKEAGVISDEVDTGRFLVIDLSAIENLTLHRGKDFQKIKESEKIEEVSGYEDVYIINETSHNIFYVGGITMNEQTFYTNYTSNNVDKKAVNLRYVDGIKIPEGFRYIGNKEVGILITNDIETYKWREVDEVITKVPETLDLEESEKHNFIKSVNAYHGYYEDTKGSHKVKYFTLDNWSPTYKGEGVYQDKNGDTAYIPNGFQVSETPGETTIEEGLVVRDSNKNEFIWIPVTKESEYVKNTTYSNANISGATISDTNYLPEGIEITTDQSIEEIEKELVLRAGGFYIARYEAGKEGTDTLVSKRESTVWTEIKQEEAKEKAKTLINEEHVKSALISGTQWDVTMEFISSKSRLDGKGNLYDINTAVTEGESNRHTGNKENSGQNEADRVCNIYDLEGNTWEYVAEKNTYDSRSTICC